MADIVTYAKSGYPILNGGVVTAVDQLGNSQYIGPTGVFLETASQTYTKLETLYTDRWDDYGDCLLLE